MYQTDFDDYIRDDGCLFAEIVTRVEDFAHKFITDERIRNLVDELNHADVISHEDDMARAGMYVWDHAGVGNAALAELGATMYKFKYHGCMYMPWYAEKHDLESWGSRTGNAIILQITTLAGNGHFRGLNHDPWRPAREMKDLKSVRYYEILHR